MISGAQGLNEDENEFRNFSSPLIDILHIPLSLFYQYAKTHSSRPASSRDQIQIRSRLKSFKNYY